MKTGSGVNLNFLSNFSQLLLSNITLFTVLFTADVGFFCYLAFRLGICFQVGVDIITQVREFIGRFNHIFHGFTVVQTKTYIFHVS